MVPSQDETWVPHTMGTNDLVHTGSWDVLAKVGNRPPPHNTPGASWISNLTELRNGEGKPPSAQERAVLNKLTLNRLR